MATTKPKQTKPPSGPLTFVQIGLMCELLLPDREAHQLAALLRKAYECSEWHMFGVGGKVRTLWQAPLVRTQQVRPEQVQVEDPMGRRQHEESPS